MEDGHSCPSSFLSTSRTGKSVHPPGTFLPAARLSLETVANISYSLAPFIRCSWLCSSGSRRCNHLSRPRKLQARIVVAACGLCVLGTGLMFTCGGSTPVGTGIEIFPGEFAFGVVPQGKVLQARVRVVNRTRSPTVILAVVPECGCTASRIAVQRLEAGASTKLECALDTASLRGNVAKRVVVRYRVVGDSDEQAAVLRLTAFVERDYTVVPSRLEFHCDTASTVPVTINFRDADITSARLRDVLSNTEAISTRVTTDERVESRKVLVNVMFDPSRGHAMAGMRSAVTMVFQGTTEKFFQIPIEFR